MPLPLRWVFARESLRLSAGVLGGEKRTPLAGGAPGPSQRQRSVDERDERDGLFAWLARDERKGLFA